MTDDPLSVLLDDLKSFRFSASDYYEDAEPRDHYDSVLSGKLKSLLGYCSQRGWSDLAASIRELLPLEGTAVEALETIRSFIVPEARRLVDAATPKLPQHKSIYCNQCMRETRHRVRESPFRTHYEDDLGSFVVQNDHTYTICECAGCADVAFVCETTDNVSPETGYDIYPAREFRRRPAWLRSLRKGHFTTDPKVDLIDEIYTALHHDADRLAVIGLRSLIEHVMVEQVGDHGRFVENIAKFREAGHISATQHDVLKNVVELGHAVTHRSYSPKRDDTLRALDVTETLIKTLYVDRSALDDVVAALPVRPPRPVKPKG